MSALVEIENLRVEFAKVKAVDGVSLSIPKGETLGLVGESGSGKTTLGKASIRLIPPTAGTVKFDGMDLASLKKRELRKLRTRMQVVFQDPNSSLNPRMRIVDIVGDGLLIHGLAKKKDLPDRVAAILERVGLSRNDLRKYPHQFSGGQHQRIGIARALILDPDYIMLDEPVSALDVSIRGEIMKLLIDLRNERNLTYLFVSHDIGVISHLSTTVAVMYLGKIVEMGPTRDVIARPQHPYTKKLMEAVPKV